MEPFKSQSRNHFRISENTEIDQRLRTILADRKNDAIGDVVHVRRGENDKYVLTFEVAVEPDDIGMESVDEKDESKGVDTIDTPTSTNEKNSLLPKL